MSGVAFALSLAVALGAAVIGGVFFTFSSFVMRGLDETGPLEATRTMQSINRTVITPSFLGVFLGTAVGAIGVAVLQWGGPDAGFAIAGAATYVVGTFAVTIAFNVPRNDALARVALREGVVDASWRQYRREWTLWNHLRGLASVVASLLLILSIA